MKEVNGMILEGCQGKNKGKLIEVTCPNCGETVEFTGREAARVCSSCGKPVLNEKMSCIFTCGHARECVGDEAYELAMKASDRIQFDMDAFRRFKR